MTEYLYSVTADLFIFLLHNAYKESFKCSYVKSADLAELLTDLCHTETDKFVSIRYTGNAKDCPYPMLRKGKPVIPTEELIVLSRKPGKGGLAAYELVLRDRKGLEAFLAKYLDAYEAGQCHAQGWNYLSHKAGMDAVESLFGESYARFGATFNVNAGLEHADFKREQAKLGTFDDPFRVYKDFRERLRLGELLLSLARKNYITIQDAAYDEAKPGLPDILVHFERSPHEIKDIEGYWLAYGGIRVNKSDGVAFYGNKRYPFASKHTLEFKLLCHLIKNHGKKLDITSVYDAIVGEAESFGDEKKTAQRKKSRIKDYVKNLRTNLGIAADKNPSVDILLAGENLLLIATPPAKA